jgi:hypothetical protein
MSSFRGRSRSYHNGRKYGRSVRRINKSIKKTRAVELGSFSRSQGGKEGELERDIRIESGKSSPAFWKGTTKRDSPNKSQEDIVAGGQDGIVKSKEVEVTVQNYRSRFEGDENTVASKQSTIT